MLTFVLFFRSLTSKWSPELAFCLKKKEMFVKRLSFFSVSFFFLHVADHKLNVGRIYNSSKNINKICEIEDYRKNLLKKIEQICIYLCFLKKLQISVKKKLTKKSGNLQNLQIAADLRPKKFPDEVIRNFT